jgi:hypothetical protein
MAVPRDLKCSDGCGPLIYECKVQSPKSKV